MAYVLSFMLTLGSMGCIFRLQRVSIWISQVLDAQ